MNIRFILLVGLTITLEQAMGQEKPKKPFQLFEEAESTYNMGNYEQALRLLDQCLTANAGYMEAYPLRASAKELLKDEAGALTDYSIYLEKNPDNTDVLMSRAVLRYKMGFYNQAKEDLFRLLTLSSNETNAIFYKQNMSVEDKNPMMTTTKGGHNSYVYNYLGLTESKLKNFKTAVAYFDTAIRLDSKEPDYFVNRGLAKESIADSTAFVDYERALRLNPNHTLAQHNLEALKAKKLQSMSSEDRLSLTIEADSTMLYPYIERAQQRYEAGYYKGAVDDYSKALELDTSKVEIWLGRGLAREKIKDYKGAFSDYTKAIDLKEDFAKAWLNRGNVLVKLDRHEDAIEDYNVALVYKADYSLAFYNRAMAKMKLKKNAEACADLHQAEELGMKVEEKIKAKACQK